VSHRRLAVVLLAAVALAGPACAKRDPAVKTLQVYDLLAAFPRAVVAVPGPDYVARGDFTVAREALPSLYLHPTSTVQFPPVRVSSQSVLTFRIGVRDEAWSQPGDGVDFTVFVQGTGPRVKAFSRYIDPKHVAEDRHWIDARVPLRAFAGQDVRITFATGPGPAGDTTNDWAVWGEPMIILAAK